MASALVGEQDMQRGRVKWSNEARGYGFVALESGQDGFVQYRGLGRPESRNALATSSIAAHVRPNAMARRGELPAFKVRAQSRIHRADLEAWIVDQRGVARPKMK